MDNVHEIRPGIFWDVREPVPAELREILRQWDEEKGEDHLLAVHPLYRPPRHHRAGQHWQRQERRHIRRVVPEPRAAEEPEDEIDNGFLPPVAVDVSVAITHETARVTVVHCFINDTNCHIPKASYTFPLPPGSTVVNFTCRIGRDRILEGKVRPKEEARDVFNRQVNQGQCAGLVDQNAPDIFTTTLGHIPANTRLKSELTFILLLKHKSETRPNLDEHGMTFTLPIYIAPRYGTPTPEVVHLLRRSVELKQLSVSLGILAATDILRIECPNHQNAEIKLGQPSRRGWADFVADRNRLDHRLATITLPDSTGHLEKDFTLNIYTSPSIPQKPFAVLELHPNVPNHSALMLTMPPRYMLGPSGDYPGGEIIFVADRSGSMGDKIEALKQAMAFFIAYLPPECKFNIWSFGSSFSSLWPESQRFDTHTREIAEQHVSNEFVSNMGGTKLLRALKVIVATGCRAERADIIVLTDGAVWDRDETVNFVKKTRLEKEGRVRFFTLGIGDAVSHELVEGIAKAGGGYAEVIQTASNGGWEGSVVAVLDAAKQDHLFPVSASVLFDNDGREGSVPKVRISPHDISNISPFLRNRIFMLIPGATTLKKPHTVKIKCMQPSGEIHQLEIPVAALSIPDTKIHQFAARALLGDLERGESYIHAGSNLAPDSPEMLKMAKIEGEKLGCSWSLVSKWTSFVAVERRVPVEDVEGDPFLGDLDDGQPEHSRNTMDLLRRRGSHHEAQPNALPAPGPADEDDASSDSDSDSDATRAGGGGGVRDSDDDDDDGNDGENSDNGASTPDPGDQGAAAGRDSPVQSDGGHSLNEEPSGEDKTSGSSVPQKPGGVNESSDSVVHEASIFGPTVSPLTSTHPLSIYPLIIPQQQPGLDSNSIRDIATSWPRVKRVRKRKGDSMPKKRLYRKGGDVTASIVRKEHYVSHSDESTRLSRSSEDQVWRASYEIEDSALSLSSVSASTSYRWLASSAPPAEMGVNFDPFPPQWDPPFMDPSFADPFTEPFYTNVPNAFPAGGTQEFSSHSRTMAPDWNDASLAMAAPQNNLPASQAIQFTTPTLTDDPIVRGKRDIVRLLLSLQADCGEFVERTHRSDGTTVDMKQALGSDFETCVLGCAGISPGLSNAKAVEPTSGGSARTTCVIALLTLHFGFCHDVWGPMKAKADDFLLGIPAEAARNLYAYAEDALKDAVFAEGTGQTPLQICLPQYQSGTDSRSVAASSTPTNLTKDAVMKADGPGTKDEVQSTPDAAKHSSGRLPGVGAPTAMRTAHTEHIQRLAAEREARGQSSGQGDDCDIPLDL